MTKDMMLTPDEAGRLIHLRNEMLLMVQEWKKHGWGKGLAARFKALSMVLADEPEPSPGFQNLAYEVYCHLWGPQEAMVDHARGCRGGFTAGEIVAMLYARGFPKDQWKARLKEALKGATL